MRAAIGLRLLLALTLMGWGQFVFAEDYYWVSGADNTPRATPLDVCSSVPAGYNGYNWSSFRVVKVYDYLFDCFATRHTLDGSASWDNIKIAAYGPNRFGDSCPSGATYNSLTGECEVPKDCSSTSGNEIRKAQTCTYDLALKLVICDSEISYEGCLYTKGGKSDCVSDIATGDYICTSSFYGSGGVAGSGPDTCSGESCSPVVSDNPGPNCVSSNGIELCSDPQEPGCGTINGVSGCYQEPPGCGYFNGTYQCIDADKPNRNCGYFNGVQTCFDPNDPTKAIPPTSSDHPSNGGNADGDDTNDPLPSGSTDSSAQGSDEGATNEAIGELGDTLGGKIDKTNSLLDGITGILDGVADSLSELTEGLLGDDYDGSGDGNGSEIEGIGAGVGSDLAQTLTQQMTDAQEEQSVSDELNLEQIASDIDGNDFFGANSQIAGLLQFADELLPMHTGCVDYTIPLSLGNYRADITLPMCRLSALRPLLEWLIYMITAIGLWNITYSTLRMENAKASKGGF